MVPRYARPAMTAIWEPEARYRIWFEIEAHATQKLGDLGVVPQSGAKALWDWWATNPAIDVGRIFSDSFAGIAPASVPAFVLFQLVGGAVAVATIRTLYPDISSEEAAEIMLPHDAELEAEAVSPRG